jgi:hypothetical protein
MYGLDGVELFYMIQSKGEELIGHFIDYFVDDTLVYGRCGFAHGVDALSGCCGRCCFRGKLGISRFFPKKKLHNYMAQ